MAYIPTNWVNDTTELSAENMNKIEMGIVNAYGHWLLAVSDTEPTECYTGDEYYNTTTKKIYTAVGVDDWGTTGKTPETGVFYIVFDTQTVYSFNGIDLISVGGGAGGSGGDTTPIGTIEAYSGSTAPNGYLMCDGSAVSRTTYKDLYNVIGTTYGNGDGSTTFNLPDIKGRVIVMQDANDTDFDTLGETGGSKYLQEHTHSYLRQPVSYNELVQGATVLGASSYNATYKNPGAETDIAGTGDSGNLQPYIVLNYIIKVQKTAGEVLSEQLPVGTEVDFDGTSADIPIGWEQVDGKSLVAYTLYNGPTTNDNITLSDSAVNYSQIEIFFHSVLGYRQSVKVIQNNIIIDLSTAYYESSANLFYVVGVKGTLQGTNLTLSDFFVARNGAIDDLVNKYIYIDKVIGYKEV